jgi:hypothetical protein
MSASAERLACARQMVDGVLEGRITQESDPAVFSDDLLYFNVRILESQEGDWLFARLAETRFAAQHRRLVADHLSPGGQGRALAIIEAL